MKKYLNWDFAGVAVLMIGCAVACIAFVHYSYAWSDEYSVALKYAMRIIGFVGTVFFPTKFVSFIVELENEEVIEDLERDYNELAQFIYDHGEDE